MAADAPAPAIVPPVANTTTCGKVAAGCTDAGATAGAAATATAGAGADAVLWAVGAAQPLTSSASAEAPIRVFSLNLMFVPSGR